LKRKAGHWIYGTRWECESEPGIPVAIDSVLDVEKVARMVIVIEGRGDGDSSGRQCCDVGAVPSQRQTQQWLLSGRHVWQRERFAERSDTRRTTADHGLKRESWMTLYANAQIISVYPVGS